jgi:hypothetical protein
VQADEALRLATCFAQPGKVGLHLSICGEGCERCVEYGCRTCVGGALDAVVHPLPFSASTDNSGVTEIGQMPGYFWLTLLQNLHEVADAHLSTAHEIEQPEAGPVSQSGKQARQIKGSGGTSHISYGIRLDRYV